MCDGETPRGWGGGGSVLSVHTGRAHDIMSPGSRDSDRQGQQGYLQIPLKQGPLIRPIYFTDKHHLNSRLKRSCFFKNPCQFSDHQFVFKLRSWEWELATQEDIWPNCHLTIHKLNVCIKRNAFYNFQIDASFMGRYNEKKDVFHEERMLSGTKNQRQECRGRGQNWWHPEACLQG